MDVKKFLLANQIYFEEISHPPTPTVEISQKVLVLPKDVSHTKNLFLKSKNNFFLISIPAEKHLDLKKIKLSLNLRKRLSFASEKELSNFLSVKPGAVSIFSLLSKNAKNVILILDKDLINSKKVGFHPNKNTSTLILSQKNLQKFLNLLNNKKIILDI